MVSEPLGLLESSRITYHQDFRLDHPSWQSGTTESECRTTSSRDAKNFELPRSTRPKKFPLPFGIPSPRPNIGAPSFSASLSVRRERQLGIENSSKISSQLTRCLTLNGRAASWRHLFQEDFSGKNLRGSKFHRLRKPCPKETSNPHHLFHYQ